MSAVRRGLTLVEVLVVCAVVAVLAAVANTVAARAMERGKIADEMSQLRQLGAAQAMYTEAYDAPATRADQLVDARLADKALLMSRADRFPLGIRNKQLGRDPHRTVEVADYPITYLGPGDFGFPARVVAAWQNSGRNAGWLVSLTTARVEDYSGICGEGGTYRRLLFDGSVQTRPAGLVRLPDGEIGCTTESRFRDGEGS